MANFGAEDVPALMADFGVDIIVGSDTTKGLVDREGIETLEGVGGASQSARRLVVTVQKDKLALTRKGAITVDGTSYIIVAWHDREDGELVEITVGK